MGEAGHARHRVTHSGREREPQGVAHLQLAGAVAHFEQAKAVHGRDHAARRDAHQHPFVGLGAGTVDPEGAGDRAAAGACALAHGVNGHAGRLGHLAATRRRHRAAVDRQAQGRVLVVLVVQGRDRDGGADAQARRAAAVVDDEVDAAVRRCRGEAALRGRALGAARGCRRGHGVVRDR